MLSIVKKHIPAFVGLFLVVAILVVSATFFTASHAAAPTKTWSIGGRTVGGSTSGKAVFNNRSVEVSGKVTSFAKAAGAGSCDTVTFIAKAGGRELSSGSQTVCRTSRSFAFPLPANVRGGASVVQVILSSGGISLGSVNLAR